MTITTHHPFTVLAKGYWERRFGYLGSSLSCQLTAIKTRWGLAYVRENVLLQGMRGGGFHLSSNFKLGITGGIIRGKVRAGSTSGCTQVLELCADKQHWQQIAEQVAAADALNRPVLPHKQFTFDWAQRTLSVSI